MIDGRGGNDWIHSGSGNDFAFGGAGNDRVIGGADDDHVYGGDGNDKLSGDDGRDNLPILGKDNDSLSGGKGDDVLFVGWGWDRLLGGEGRDTFVFQSHNSQRQEFPPGLSTILDFNAAEDTFAFDVPGLSNDSALANFINHASVQSGYPVDTFYSGKAPGANGEHVVVITDRSFVDGSDAARAISGEAAGDIYHDNKTHTANLAYVTSENSVDPLVELSGVQTVADLANMRLTGSNFTFV